ncbi:MAG: glycosyltransferase [Clostridia bacterium]
MKILMIVDDFAGGAGNIVQLLAKRLLDKGNEVSIFLTYKHSEPRYDLNGIHLFNVNVSVITDNRFLKLRRMVAAVKRIIEMSGCELVISFLDNNNSLACLALWNKNIPIIVSERSNPLSIFPKFPWNYIRRFAYKRADVVTVQFDGFRKFDGNRYLKKCYVTHNIIEKPGMIKTEWREKKISFVSLGRYAGIKRYDLMIRLFGRFSQGKDNVELHIFGDGILNDDLQEEIKKTDAVGKVFLHNEIANVHEELIKHSVYLMTSLQEGFPNALCEALAVGLPAVVICCHDGIAKLVRNGENGFCVPEGNDGEFINAMERLALSPEGRKKMGDRSRHIAGQYDIEVVMKEWDTCIGKAIENRQNI